MKTFCTFMVVALACGAVVALDGEPIPGADVKVGRKPPGSGQIVGETSTDSKGEFEFNDLPDGTYFVRIVVSGKSRNIGKFEDGTKFTIPPRGTGQTSSRRAVAPPTLEKQIGSSIVTITVDGRTIKGSLRSKLTKADSQR